MIISDMSQEVSTKQLHTFKLEARAILQNSREKKKKRCDLVHFPVTELKPK